MKNGYVYILINASMPGYLKIGRTERDVNDRIRELSSKTSVPTPFILTYKEFFNDCHWAEKMVHSIISNNGHRLTKDREFFTLPLAEAIQVIMEVKKMDTSSLEETIDNYTSEEIKEEKLSVSQADYEIVLFVKEINHIISPYSEVSILEQGIQAKLDKILYSITDPKQLNELVTYFDESLNSLYKSRFQITYSIYTEYICNYIYKKCINEFKYYDEGTLLSTAAMFYASAKYFKDIVMSYKLHQKVFEISTHAEDFTYSFDELINRFNLNFDEIKPFADLVVKRIQDLSKFNGLSLCNNFLNLLSDFRSENINKDLEEYLWDSLKYYINKIPINDKFLYNLLHHYLMYIFEGYTEIPEYNKMIKENKNKQINFIKKNISSYSFYFLNKIKLNEYQNFALNFINRLH